MMLTEVINAALYRYNDINKKHLHVHKSLSVMKSLQDLSRIHTPVIMIQ